MATSRVTVGVDACPVGWFATVIDANRQRMETFEGEADEIYVTAGEKRIEDEDSSPR